MKENIYSRNAVYETLRAKRRQPIRLLIAEKIQEKGHLTEILELAKQQKVPVERVPRQRLDTITPQHQGVILEAGHYPYMDISDILENAKNKNEPLFVLILDSLQDPQNFGTLLRTAEAVGVHGIVLPLARTVEVTPAVVNASSGASEHLLIAQANLVQAIEAFKEAGAWVVGLDESPRSQTPDQVRLDGALAVVVGSEGEGIRQLVRQKCDFMLRLPMHGQIESLNASVAGSIVLYLASLTRNPVIK
ncbi:MAG: 23S rRNA (guanosine(2251)-2'-O)-methyltransferase RlmB [Chloroflexi bacterium]|nr:23S rRNA (guanosine(2251)-2'-O)-methyltransferase RlmB [Chloroflexota bacterium]